MQFLISMGFFVALLRYSLIASRYLRRTYQGRISDTLLSDFLGLGEWEWTVGYTLVRSISVQSIELLVEDLGASGAPHPCAHFLAAHC